LKGEKKAMGLGTWLSFVVVKDLVDGILGFLKFCNLPGERVFCRDHGTLTVDLTASQS
jgi:hypothetical protein